MKGQVITILGPTASGKTALAVRLAKRLGSCVISGDAFQVYRGMDIGTAKVTPEEADGVPHYLVDCLDPRETYSAARFSELAGAIIQKENQAGRVPIIAGGTGLYIQGLLEGYTFLPRGEGRKSRWHQFYEAHGLEALREELLSRGKTEAELPVDPQRMIRMLEVLDLAPDAQAGKSSGLVYSGPVVGLTMDRAWLYERINRRVDLMMAAGLEDEVRRLLAEGVPADAQSMSGIGYKEMIPAVRGECTPAEAAEEIRKNTRHFAKRQLTWYRRMPYIRWFERTRSEPEEIWYHTIEQFVISQIKGEPNGRENEFTGHISE